jgi:glycosyltransferase involved in cell wall biosynthesis
VRYQATHHHGLKATISVIIPSRNRPQMLREAVASVLSQTFPYVEIIIVLTGGDAATTDAAHELSERTGVKVIATEPLGISATRNRGLADATGEWVSFLDDDDLWLPDKLERQMEMANLTGADVVTTNWVIFDETGDIEQWRPTGANPLPKGLSYAEAFILNNFGSVGCLIRTRALRSLGGFDVSLKAGEDWDMWRRLSHGHTIVYLDIPLIRYRVHNGNVSSNPWLIAYYAFVHGLKMRRDTPDHLRHMLRGPLSNLTFSVGVFGYLTLNRMSKGRFGRKWRSIRSARVLRASDSY